MYLGVRAILARSIERIHFANLVNFGIVPLMFADSADYDTVSDGDELLIDGLLSAVESGEELVVRNLSRNSEFTALLKLGRRQRKILLAGGLLRFSGK